jgi:dipeptidyl aminopeptidase/acylaminoacyl peptidase
VFIASLERPSEQRELLRASSNVAVASNRLLFMREGTLMVQDFDSERARLLGDAVPLAEDVLYLAGARWGVFSAARQGLLVYQQGNVRRESELVWLDRAGRELSQLGGGVFHRDLALSRDGRFVVVEVIDEVAGASDLWIYNVNRGLKTRFTFHPDMDWFPAWSPDGASIAFASNRGESNNIYLKSTAGAQDEELLLEKAKIELAPESWSSDGRWLVFGQADQSASFDLWSLPLDGGEAMPVVATSFNEVLPSLAPNGKWLAYVSDESGRNEVYVTTFPEPVRRWQVSTNGGSCPRWRHDSSELYVLNLDGSLSAYAVAEEGGAFNVTGSEPLFSWSSPPTLRRPYDVAADGRFLVNRSTGASKTSPLTVVLNWERELER